LYFTSLCDGVVRQIFESINLVVSLAVGSTEVRDPGADGNNRTPSNNSVSTRQVQLGQGTISGGITVLIMLQIYTILHCFLSPAFCDTIPYFSESAKNEGNILWKHVKNVLTTVVAGQSFRAVNMTSTHGSHKRYICRSIDADYRSNCITDTTSIGTYLFRHATFICPNPKSALEVLSPPPVR